MAIWLKRGATAEAKADSDRKVRDIVEAALADIAARGDRALRDMSVQFDGWDREDYRLSQAEIDAAVDSLPRKSARISSSHRPRCATSRRSSAIR